MRISRSLFPCLALLLIAAGVLGGQTLTGTTRDMASGARVPGVVVSLLDVGGGLTARAISDRDGKFTMTVTALARSIQVRRIGFRPFDNPLPDSAHTTRATIDIALRQVPQTLDPVPVTGRRCADPSKSAPQAAALWEQARTGFLATVAARDAMPATLSDLAFRLDAPDQSVTISRTGTTIKPTTTGPASVTTVIGASVEQRVANRPWVAGRTPEIFVARGYLEMEGDYPHLYGPDADVLLDPSFEATHCFSVIDHDAAHPGEVGVAFQPVIGRDTLADIRGVLWMNQAPLGLRTLEFTYVGRNAADKDRSGGWLSFRTADNGVVLIDEWSLHYPARGTTVGMVAVGRDSRGGLTSTTVAQVDHQRQQMIGGSLLGAKWQDGTTLTRTLPSIHGTVVDSLTGSPVGGAAATLTEAGYLAQTDAHGAFDFSPLMPGRYSVTVTDLLWARYGVPRGKSVTVDAFGGATLAATAPPIALGPPLAAARSGCDARAPFRNPMTRPQLGSEIRTPASLDRGKGFVGVRLVDTTGAPVTAPVSVTLIGPNGRDKTDKVFPSTGRLLICGVGAGTLTMNSTDVGGRHGRAELRPTGAELVDTITIVMRTGGHS